jgi:hypothetical protein
MQDVVDALKSGLANSRVGEISLHKVDARFQIAQPFAISGGEIIDDPHPIPFTDEPVNQVGADESGAAAH